MCKGGDIDPLAHLWQICHINLTKKLNGIFFSAETTSSDGQSISSGVLANGGGENFFTLEQKIYMYLHLSIRPSIKRSGTCYGISNFLEFQTFLDQIRKSVFLCSDQQTLRRKKFSGKRGSPATPQRPSGKFWVKFSHFLKKFGSFSQRGVTLLILIFLVFGRGISPSKPP